MAARKRFEQGWVDALFEIMDALVDRTRAAVAGKETISLAYIGNVVHVWERFAEEEIHVDLGSDQTSLHNPWSGGYYPVGLTFEQANEMMADNPEGFREKVQESLRRHVHAINRIRLKGPISLITGMPSSWKPQGPGQTLWPKMAYISGILPMFRIFWDPCVLIMALALSDGFVRRGSLKYLKKTDAIALKVLKDLKVGGVRLMKYNSKCKTISSGYGKQSKTNLVVGSQARILYADAEGRWAKIAEAFNQAIRSRDLSAPVVLGRDHHDVSGTDSAVSRNQQYL